MPGYLRKRRSGAERFNEVLPGISEADHAEPATTFQTAPAPNYPGRPDFARIERKLKNRPRKTLGLRTPSEVLLGTQQRGALQS
jgi:hypothetical protein